MADRKRPEQEFQEQLKSQLRFLERSADWFDEGDETEARRMAHALRVILHSKGRQTSLLQHLGRQAEPFADTTMFRGNPGQPHATLAMLAVRSDNESQRYVSLLGDGPRVPFDEWWNAIVLTDGNQASLTRRSLVISIAEQDGGSHVDAVLNEPYARMSREDAVAWNPLGLPDGPERSVVSVTMRQIAHEVLLTLQPGYAKTRQRDPHEMLVACLPPGTRLHIDEWRHPELAGDEPPSVKIRVMSPAPQQPTPRLAKCSCGTGKRFKDCCGSLAGM